MKSNEMAILLLLVICSEIYAKSWVGSVFAFVVIIQAFVMGVDWITAFLEQLNKNQLKERKGTKAFVQYYKDNELSQRRERWTDWNK